MCGPCSSAPTVRRHTPPPWVAALHPRQARTPAHNTHALTTVPPATLHALHASHTRRVRRAAAPRCELIVHAHTITACGRLPCVHACRLQSTTWEPLRIQPLYYDMTPDVNATRTW
ncbi:hypothetical protein EON67_08345 [archaeon]|nr:MAG: hypothetical protein EON67_08345 [archaeon]